MTGKLFTSVAAGAVLATASVLSPMAFAQSQPSTGGGDAPLTQTAPDAAKPDSPAPQTKAPAATTGMEQADNLTTQSADQISAKTYMGQSVYNGENESIGSINDLILQKQGGVVAAVVGVGGFLGIGQKNVAVPFDKINASQNPKDGTVKLTTTETAESLKAAPEFKTLAMQASDKAASSAGTSTMPATDDTTTSSTTNK